MKMMLGLIGSGMALGLAGAAVAQPANDAAEKRAFMVCSACHTVAKGGGAHAGPNLYGMIGAKAGMPSTYPLSPALKGSGLVWTEATLDRFIENPRAVIPGNRMAFMGVKNPAQRALIVAYLKRVTK